MQHANIICLQSDTSYGNIISVLNSYWKVTHSHCEKFVYSLRNSVAWYVQYSYSYIKEQKRKYETNTKWQQATSFRRTYFLPQYILTFDRQAGQSVDQFMSLLMEIYCDWHVHEIWLLIVALGFFLLFLLHSVWLCDACDLLNCICRHEEGRFSSIYGTYVQ